MKLFPVPRTGLFVEMWTRDEHCPPHLHVANEAVPWEARFEFSFLIDTVRLIDIDPISGAPSARTIDRIKVAIATNLPKCRSEWWTRIGTCCVDNRWVRMSSGGRISLTAGRGKGTAQIESASYDPATGLVNLRTRTGDEWTIKAGAAVEAESS
jgi:hypothetical protein